MGGVTKRRVAGVAITGIVVAGVVGVTSLSVSGQAAPPPVETTDPLPPVPYGTLTINLTDRAGTYTLVGPDGNTIVPPETIITNQPCAAVETGSGGLLVLTPNPNSPTSAADTVQLRNSAIGVNTGNTSCGASNAAVISGPEQLKIELGSTIPEGVFAKSASLQLAQLKRGDLKWKVDDRPLSSAIKITQSPQRVLVEPAELFTSITVESTSRRDNEGLSVFDGTSFELVTLDPSFEFAVDCGEQVTKIGGDGDIANTATFFRGENGIKPGASDECVDVGVIVEIVSDDPGTTDVEEDWVFWDNSVRGVDGSVQAVNGTVTIEWAPISPEFAGEPTEINYDGTGNTFDDALWCLAFSEETVVVDGISRVTYTATLPPFTGDGANDDGTAPWCLVSSVQTLDGDGNVNRVETFFGSGDPLSRTKRSFS